MRWYAGTSGFSYKEWKGEFYPEDLGNDGMLGYYASQLPAVEINNTFYRMPRSAVLEKWAASVPENFRFVIKASRRITHHARLKEAEEPTRYLVEKLKALGDKLGAVLFQLPPNLRADTDRLEAFLNLLPEGLPAAFEFRHPSWDDDAVYALLDAAGAALCVSEAEDSEAPERIATANWLYLRLRKPGYSNVALKRWIKQAEASGADRAFVFFKHEDAGAGPRLATQFLALAEAPARKAPQAVRRKPKARRTGTGS